jgi:hypothetical protein
MRPVPQIGGGGGDGDDDDDDDVGCRLGTTTSNGEPRPGTLGERASVVIELSAPQAPARDATCRREPDVIVVGAGHGDDGADDT